jgi:histidine ammonia-lyase
MIEKRYICGSSKTPCSHYTRSFKLNHHHHTLDTVGHILSSGQPLVFTEEMRQRTKECRDFLEKLLCNNETPYYGINTGFGSLCNVHIPDAEIEQLQLNLVRSHAAGTGDYTPYDIGRIMLLLKIHALSLGYSGVRTELVELLIQLYNAGAVPVVFELGSLGASGDLAPLAHLSLPLIGEGELWYKGQRLPAAQVLDTLGLSPMTFKAKEALALLNGTQFSAAYAVWCLLATRQLTRQAQYNAALSTDAFNCHYTPFLPVLHQIRPHAGQVTTARELLRILADSEMVHLPKESLQDPYAFRCVPQVHGASLDAIAYVEQVVTTEMNSVTDNPNIFPEEGSILSGGNFHAQPLALALDYLAIALSELGSIAERRIYQLISGQRGLPNFLTPKPGLHSGMMIAQYTAASIVSQNKNLSAPASVDSIVSCNGQEDHVSMAANAATKARRVVLNLQRLLAIEWMVAAQAMEFRRPLRTSPELEAVLARYRQVVPRLDDDRVLSTDIEKTINFWKNDPFN